jgi:hypothetical protein
LLGFLSKEMAHRIQAVFPDARVVIFVRSQPEMIAACYQQYVRGGGTYPVRRYLWPLDHLRGAAAQPYKIPRFSFDHFDYERLVAHYIELFGRERVHVFAYEEVQRLLQPRHQRARARAESLYCAHRERQALLAPRPVLVHGAPGADRGAESHGPVRQTRRSGRSAGRTDRRLDSATLLGIEPTAGGAHRAGSRGAWLPARAAERDRRAPAAA